MRSCQQQQRDGGHSGSGHAGGGRGPCGEMSVGHKPNTQEKGETPPNETAHPN
jgi:hypothetical protein